MTHLFDPDRARLADDDPPHAGDPYFFGYGSLVNRSTHDYSDAHRATVTGWRRAWRKSPRRQRCFLTVVPDPDTTIDGLIAAVPGADWAVLDEREAAYARLDASRSVTHPVGRELDIAIYAVPEDEAHVPGPDDPVILSYLDVVVQGFLTEYGRAGVERFFATTQGWDVPILDDRAHPIYARHRLLADGERRLVDEMLQAVGARVLRG
ncbi:gamma-glutamylcyclotransferase family protein [Maritimibacter sp. DP1N21-5]|uniref:gamma-glutamylcyclotransferase family protein n=1 Tax=Maritimibacter sp. DP1N21-5 TaxID=2836867 RepID=UPI001C43C7C9|nr:gamma-glutamylcyclotransferase family protein [Maritimibacter sp. DP1N21-5]MBV7408689.1 gamma-glutamylcyclotransferase [Maritimibacter sp. DP1N21-5]